MIDTQQTFLYLVLATWIYMTIWFCVGVYANRYDIADTAWGLGFVAIAWLAYFITGSRGSIKTVAVILVTIWGLRLAFHITKRNLNKPEDERYKAMRKNWKKFPTIQAYVSIFILQGLLLLVVSLPVIAIMASNASASILTWLGFTVWIGGIVFEAIADRQLRNFIANEKSPKNSVMNKGLWKYSRHPNYFGEVTLWWGAAIVALSLGSWQGMLGALMITYLITQVSGIPLLEKRYEHDDAYQKYAEKTSRLIPQLPKK